MKDLVKWAVLGHAEDNYAPITTEEDGVCRRCPFLSEPFTRDGLINAGAS